MPLTLLRARDYRVMPWKNGRGVTTEIARAPAEGDPDWRVSVARVETDGEFSFFPGYDRWILALDGAGMVLRHREPGLEVALDALQVWRFRGDWTTSCRLRGGPFRDFNVMVRRAAYVAEVSVVRLDGELTWPPGLIYCVEGAAECESLRLEAGETFVADEPVGVGGTATLIRAGISALEA